MTRAKAVIDVLQRHAGDFRARGVTHLYLFGSTARGEDKSESDVDIFFDYDKPDFSLIDLVGVSAMVTNLLETKADVMTRGSLHPVLKDRIEAEAIKVY